MCNGVDAVAILLQLGLFEFSSENVDARLKPENLPLALFNGLVGLVAAPLVLLVEVNLAFGVGGAVGEGSR